MTIRTPVSGKSTTRGPRRKAFVTGAVALALLVAPLAVAGASQAAGDGSNALKKQPPGATAFRLSSFNLLGAGHTAPGGDRKGWASGSTRMKWATQILDQNSIDVVGFQEMQQPQFDKFDEIDGSTFGIFPGDQLTTAAMANSIAWRKDEFTLLRTETIQIPYFDGNLIRMPYVLLQNKQTGQQAWFFNTHNPADANGPAQKWRDKAVKMRSTLVNGLRQQYPDDPGLRHRRHERPGALLLPHGRQHRAGVRQRRHVRLRRRARSPTPSQVDWVMGTSDTSFTGYTDLHDALVQKTTDHFVIYGDANVPPPSVQQSPVTRVLVLSVEGLRPSAIRKAGDGRDAQILTG